MNELFREQEKQEKLRRAEARLVEERVMRERMLSVERAQSTADVNTINDLFCQREQQLRIAAQAKRQEEIKRQKCKDTELAEMIEKKKRDSVLQESLRLQLKNCPELRELEQKLLLAKVAKEQAMQKAQLIAAERLKRKEEKEFAEKLAEEIKKEEIAVQLKEKEQKAVQKQYHDALDKQIAIQSANDEEKAKQLLEDRKLIDQMVAKLREDDIEEARQKIQERVKFCEQIEEYRKVKEEMERLEAQRQAEDELKAADYRLAQEYRTQEQAERRRIQLFAKMKQQRKLLNYLQKLADQRMREENLRVDLAVQEKELKEKDRDKISIQKKNRLQAEAQEIYSMQMWLRAQREELERKQDELFTKYMLEKFYREEKLASMSERKRREKQKEHRKIILNMIEERRAKMLAEKEQEMADYLHQTEIEKEKRNLVDKERQRILLENAGELLGFLPKGILKDYEEVEKLGEEFKQFYCKKSPSSDDES